MIQISERLSSLIFKTSPMLLTQITEVTFHPPSSRRRKKYKRDISTLSTPTFLSTSRYVEKQHIINTKLLLRIKFHLLPKYSRNSVAADSETSSQENKAQGLLSYAFLINEVLKCIKSRLFL